MRSPAVPTLVLGVLGVAGLPAVQAPPAVPTFALVQPELFGASGGQPNAWADVDGDGDLDLFVGFRGRADRLYIQTDGRFEDVAARVGLADERDTRAAAWGDIDGDGDPDLLVGFADTSVPVRVFRNDAGGSRFVDVAAELGIDLRGVSRQPVWIDYDGDGDVDLFMAFRDRPNRILRNDGGRFTDVTEVSGLGDPRKSVGAVWWDFDADGDLDVFVANQEGDANGLFRNDGGRFTDVAADAGVAAVPRPKEDGGVGPALADFDLDGDIDLFVANYGPSALYRNEGGGRFADRARASGIDVRTHVTTAAWGDVDGDGRPDLYLGAFLAGEPHYRDWLFLNRGPRDGAWRFDEALPALLREHDATHGVQLVDYDGDGAVDLALTNNHPEGGHFVLRNVTEGRGAGLSVVVTDAAGRRTRAGSEVRVYAAGTRRLLAAGLVDSGSGYCSQGAAPVHVALGAMPPDRVDVEVTVPAGGRRAVTRVEAVEPRDGSRVTVVTQTPVTPPR